MEDRASSVIYLLVWQTGWQLINVLHTHIHSRVSAVSCQYMLAIMAHPTVMDSPTKVLLSGQILPEQLLCVPSEWKGWIPLRMWQCTDRWLVGFNAALQVHVNFPCTNRLLFNRTVDNTMLTASCSRGRMSPSERTRLSCEHCACELFSCHVLGVLWKGEFVDLLT